MDLVASLLESLGRLDALPLFVDAGVRDATLAWITSKDLEACGVPLGLAREFVVAGGSRMVAEDPDAYVEITNRLSRLGRVDLVGLLAANGVNDALVDFMSPSSLQTLGVPLGVATALTAVNNVKLVGSSSSGPSSSSASSVEAGGGRPRAATGATSVSVDSVAPSKQASVASSSYRDLSFTEAMPPGWVVKPMAGEGGGDGSGGGAEGSEGGQGKVAVYLTALDGSFHSVSQAFLDMVGYTMDQLPRAQQALVTDEYKMLHAALLESLLVTGSAGPLRMVITARDGTPMVVEHSATRVTAEGEAGLVCNFLVAFDHEARSDDGALKLGLLAECSSILNHRYSNNDDLMRDITRVLEVAGRGLGLDLGIFSRIDDENGGYFVETAWARAEAPPAGTEFNFPGTYCAITWEAADVVAIPHMERSQYARHPCYAAFGLEAYIGDVVLVDGVRYGTVNFSSPSPLDTAFALFDQLFVSLIATLVGSAVTEFRHQQAARQYMLDLEAHAAALKASNLEIADLNRHLDHKVAARTRELQQMVAVAEAALKTKSTFMAAITHEIKTPIHHVNAMLDFLVASLGNAVKPQEAEYLAIAKGSLSSLRALVEDILDFARLENKGSGFSFRSHAFSFVEVAETVVKLLSPAAQQKALSLNCDVDEDLPPLIAGDQQRMRQVLLNLIDNAVKYTSEGSVSLYLGYTAPSSAPQSLPGGRRLAPPSSTGSSNNGSTGASQRGAVHLTVTDTGIGIAPDKTNAIFLPFAQATSGTNRTHDGSGLGLSIVRSIVTQLDGTIKVESTLDQGTSISILLPVLNDDDGMPCLLPGGDLPTPDRARASSVSSDVSKGSAALVAPAGVSSSPSEGTGPTRVRPAAPPNSRVVVTASADSITEEVSMVTSSLESGPEGSERGVTTVVSALVVDDNLTNLLISRTMLSSLFEHVDVASSGAEALKLLRSGNSYAIIFMDLCIPGMDGFEITRRIKANPAWASTPVVALSALGQPEDRVRCFEVGMVDFLAKPFTVSELQTVLGALGVLPGSLSKAAATASDTQHTMYPLSAGVGSMSGTDLASSCPSDLSDDRTS